MPNWMKRRLPNPPRQAGHPGLPEMLTFGHPVDLYGLVEVCTRWKIAFLEDGAESLGSLYKGRRTGTICLLETLCLNGNKITITCTSCIATTKQPYPYEYVHDEIS